MSELPSSLLWVGAPVVGVVVVHALYHPLSRLLTAAFAVPYTLTADLLAGLSGGLDAYRAWWREQFREPSVRALLGSLILIACLPVLVWAEMHLQAPTLDAIFELEEGALAFSLFGQGIELTPGEAFVITMVVVEAVAGIFLLEALGATHFYPIAEGSSKGRTLTLLGAALVVLVCCTAQGAFSAWRVMVGQQELALGTESEAPDAALIVAGELWASPPEDEAADLAVPEMVTGAAAWALSNVPWIGAAAIAFLIPVCAAAAGLALYHLTTTFAAGAFWLPMLLMALAATGLGWILRGIGALDQLAQRVLTVGAAAGAMLLLKRPPGARADDEPADSPDSATGLPGRHDGEIRAPVSVSGDADVIEAQAEEIEALRDQLRDHERRSRHEQYLMEVDPFEIVGSDEPGEAGEEGARP